ncbi:MAG: type II CRISPR RNA-guided endonuclease Cas9, partial [Bacteroidota bacterium]|nr:type II CRISPR RNA-guided endonuclease Cas9 [Bacteroidota bacterium]
HINYLNNEHARQKDDKMRIDLRNKLRRLEDIVVDRYENGQKVRKNMKVAKEFHKPWDTFTQDAHAALENIVVSFKQNLRVINKTVNNYQHFVDGKKVIDKQIKGDNWAIRKPMHKDTVAGQVNLRFKKTVTLSAAIDQWEMMVDKNLKTKIKQLINEGLDKKKIQKFFADCENKWMEKDISKPEIYYFSNEKDELVASRVSLNNTFNSKKIESITDTGIQKILNSHLANYDEEKDGKTIEHPELAFSPEGIEEMNKNIFNLNDGKYHQPICKVRTYEPKGNKFNVGSTGNKKDKYVEAAKGTNLFFAIYVDENGKRIYETVPLIIAIEQLKQGESPVKEIKFDEKMNKFTLQSFLCPNDLVYVPSNEQSIITNTSEIDRSRIYKFIDSSDTTANFIPVSSASTIFNLNKKDQEKLGLDFGIQNEFGVGSPQSKNQKAHTGEMIKDLCIKLNVDRLGNISF